MRFPQAMRFEDYQSELGELRKKVEPKGSKLQKLPEDADLPASLQVDKSTWRTVSVVPDLRIVDEFFDKLDNLLELARLAGFESHRMMIAGGAVRDTLLGKPVKDIDFFYSGSDEAVNSFVKSLNPTHDEVVTVDDESYEGSFEVRNITSPNFPVPIQLIQVKNVSQHFKTFNVGLSMVSYNLNGLHISKEFKKDYKSNTLTFNEIERFDYVERLSQKYPERKVFFNVKQKTAKQYASEISAFIKQKNAGLSVELEAEPNIENS